MKTERKRAVAGLVEPGAELLEADGRSTVEGGGVK